MLNIAYQRWCLGLYMGPQSCQAVLLQWRWGRMRVHGYWRMQTDPELAYPAIPIDFLQLIIDCLQELGRITELVVNIGLFHQHRSWQRQAAHYWHTRTSLS